MSDSEEEIEIEEQIEEEIEVEEEEEDNDSHNNTNNNIDYSNKSKSNNNNIINNDKDNDKEKNNNEEKNANFGEEKNFIEELIKNEEDKEIFLLLNDKKWENKKKGFIGLNNYIINNKINENNIEQLFNYIFSKLNYFKESNFNLLKEGIECLISLFTNINNFKDEHKQKIFNDKQYLNIIINGLFEKIADNKIKKVYLNLLEQLANIYTYKEVLNNLNNELKKTNKINVLKEYASYIKYLIEIKKILENNNDKNIDLLNIIKFEIRLCNNPNSKIREISINTLCLIYPYIGKDLKIYIKEIKNESVVKKIENMFNNIDSKSNENNINNNIVLDIKNNQDKKGKNCETDNIDEIPKSLLNLIDKGKWNEKKEAIDSIHKLLYNNISPNNLKDLFDIIKEKLKDGNKNLVKLIIELLYHLIETLGSAINRYSDYFISPLLSNLSDKNQALRDECLKCIQKLIQCQDFKIICYYFPELLINENNEMKNSILDLLIENYKLITKNYKQSFFNDLINFLLICLQDKNAAIRNKAEDFIKKFELLNEKDYIKKSYDFKPEICKLLLNSIRLIFNDNQLNSSNQESLIINKTKTSIKKNSVLYQNDKRRRLSISKRDISKNKRSNKSLTPIEKLNISVEVSKEKSKENLNKKEILLKTTKNMDNKNKKLMKSFVGKTTEHKQNKNISFIAKSNDKILKNKKKLKYLNLKSIDTSFDKKMNKEKNIKNNILRLNINNIKKKNYESNNVSFNLTTNNSFVNNNNGIIINSINNNIKNKKIFLHNYKLNKLLKIKRYENDKKNNFLFEIHNFDYLPKLKEISKTIFVNEFYKNICSYEPNQVIYCINQMKDIIEKKNNKNDNIVKLIENFDIVLKILGYIFFINQSSSLLKNFYEFIECYINYYEKENINFNDIESNILLNIFCDKLIFSNSQLASKSDELIFKLSDYIGFNNAFMILSNLIKYKNSKLKNIIIDVIIKIYEESNIEYNIITKSLKNIVNLYLENDLNFKNKLIELLQKIYSNLGEKDFNEYIKHFSFQQKEELLSNIIESEKKNNLKDNIKNIRSSNSEQKRIIYKSQIRKNPKLNIEKENYNELKTERRINKETNSTSRPKSNITNRSHSKNNNKNYIKCNTPLLINKSKKHKISNYNQKNNQNISIKDRKINISINTSININIKKNKKIKNSNNSIVKRNLNKIYIKTSPNKVIYNLKSIKIKTNENNNLNDISFEEIKKNNNISNNDKIKDILYSIYKLTKFESPKNKMECIVNIHDNIYSKYSLNKDIIIPKIDIIMDSLINSIRNYLENITKDIISLKYLTNTFSLICSIKEILKNISLDTQNKLVNLILDIVLYNDLKELGKKNEGLIIWKSFNSIMIRIINFCNPTNTISILIRQIINNKDNNIKYNEYCIRCLAIITNKMKDIYKEINVPEILFEINKFLVHFNINEEIIKSENINENDEFFTLKNLVSSIALFKKESIYNDYIIYINNKINGQDGIMQNNLIKLLIDNSINNMDKKE